MIVTASALAAGLLYALPMKLAGMLLLPAGWAIVVSAVALFPRNGMRALFVVAGCAVELLGLLLAFRREAK